MNDQENEKSNEQPEDETVEVDQMKLEMKMRELRDNQNLQIGILGGFVAALLGAAIWAVVTVLTGYQIGWMAVGVGLLVGFAVRLFGKGIDTSFGIAGAALSLVGCLLGNLLTVCVVLSRQESIPLLDVISRLNAEIIVGLMKATFSPMDLLFYGIAVYEGYKFAFYKIPEEELAGMVKEKHTGS